MIVPLSVVATDRTRNLQELLRASGTLWHANFDTIPGRLFGKEVEQRLSVFLQVREHHKSIHTTRYHRFMPSQRDQLFSVLQYQNVTRHARVGWTPRISEARELSVLTKLGNDRLGSSEDPQASPLYVHRIIGYYSKAFDFVPFFRNERDGVKKSEDYKEFRITESFREGAVGLLNSGLFYLVLALTQ